MNDPFAEAPAEETAPAEASTDAPRPVVASSEGKVVVTLKGGSGFNAPWIVIHADDVADAESQFDSKLVTLMEKAQKAGAHFASLAGEAPAPQSGGGSSRPLQPGQPAGSVQPPSWAPPMPDGYLYKTGAKNGKTWHAYWPVDSRSGLEKIWLNPPK